jgi:hypothetical protein
MISRLFDSLPHSPLGMLLRIIAISGAILLSGRTFLLIFFPPLKSNGASVECPRLYTCAAGGTAILLVLTWTLRSLHVYTFDNVMLTLLGFGALGFAVNRHFGPIMQTSEQRIISFCYFGGVLAFCLLLSPGDYEDDNLKNTSLYLIQGFDSFFSQIPGEFPLYGRMFVAPILYGEHTLSAVFGLYSFGDHFLYYGYGEYWLNAILGPLIPIGAFLWFRRFFPTWLSLVVAVVFCAATLDFKVWNLRGESLAWILGFSFLILLTDYLQRDRGRPSSLGHMRYAVGMAPVFLALSLAHGVTMLMVVFLSFGLTLRYLASQPTIRAALSLVTPIIVSGFIVGGPLLALSTTYSHSGLIEASTNPPAGEPDAAMEYDNVTRDLPIDQDMIPVRDHPPFMSRLNIVRIAALLPPASLAHPHISFFRARDFPGVPLKSLDQIGSIEFLAYPALIVLASIFFLTMSRSISLPLQSLFLGSVSCYILIIVLAIYLDSKSVSLFPVVAVRRTFPYSSFFYWLAIGSAGLGLTELYRAPVLLDGATWEQIRAKPLVDLDMQDALVLFRVALSTAIAHVRVRAQAKSRRVATSWEQIKARPLIELSMQDALRLLAVALFTTIARVHARAQALLSGIATALKIASFRLAKSANARSLPPPVRERLPIHAGTIACSAIVPLWFLYSIHGWEPAAKGIFSDRSPAFDLKPMFDAIAFVRDRTSVGELVYSNSVSENQFWFLSDGRVSLLDGTSIYQLYFLQRSASRRIVRFSRFARTADMNDVSAFPFKFALLYIGTSCPALCYGDPVYPPNLQKFDADPNFRRVFENASYVVYQRMDLASGMQAEFSGPADSF